MSDFIDRAALRVKLLKLQMEAQEDGDTASAGAMRLIREFVDREPVADVVPVVHAHWVGHLENDGYSAPGQWRCSRCGAMAGLNAIGNFAAISPFCGYCGAKMDEDTSHE